MSRNIYTILFLLFSIIIGFAQETIKGKVIAMETGVPIEYVNIGITKLAMGTVSDQQGNYLLKYRAVTDLVTFSSLGFESLSVEVRELVENSTVELRPKDYAIAEIEVRADRLAGDDEIFGVRNEKRGLSVGFGSRQLGAEIGAPIQIENQTLLKSANFVLNHAQGDSVYFRINIYSLTDKVVGENILRENILIAAEQKRGTITVDLLPYNIMVEHDVLLTLEWVRDDNGKGNVGITFDTKKSRELAGIYTKDTSNGPFQKLDYKPNVKPCFYFIGKQVK